MTRQSILSQNVPPQSDVPKGFPAVVPFHAKNLLRSYCTLHYAPNMKQIYKQNKGQTVLILVIYRLTPIIFNRHE